MAEEWRLIWYIAAAFSLVTGTSFALFVGRPVTPRHPADTPTAVMQTVELMPRSPRHMSAATVDRSADEDVDVPQPYIPLMSQSQDRVPPPRYSDLAAGLNNSIIDRRSLTDLPAAEPTSPIHSTHSQVISIV